MRLFVVFEGDEIAFDQFAVKLDGELVKQIHALAEARQMGINETVAALLAKGLADKT